EVVVVEVVLGLLYPERVEPHLVPRGAERRHREGLRLAAGEDRRAVRAWRDPDLDPDVADLVGGPPVRALLVHRDTPPDDVLLQLVEGELDAGAALLVRLGVRLGISGELLEHLLLDGLG